MRDYLLTSLRYLLAVGSMKLPFGRTEAGVADLLGESLRGDILLASSVPDLAGM